jgi:general secretion pathway protein D
MGKNVGFLGAGLCAVLSLSCGPGTAAFHEGRKAEMRKDWDTAVIQFGRALQSQPENPQYLIHEKLARTNAGYFHLKQGQKLLSENRVDEATGEFQRAVAVDPSNQAAAQWLQRVLQQQATAKAQRQKILKQSLETRDQTDQTSVVTLKPFSSEVISHLHIGPDSRKVFEILGKLADINVAFHQTFQPRPMSLDLSNVKLEDAFHIAAYSAGVFWKVITPNSILVIPDNRQNRQEFEDQVLKTYYLANPLEQTDRQALVTTIKQVLGPTSKVFDNPAANAIIIYDTPEKVAAAEALLHSLDLGKAEILIDVAILEANTDRLRQLGLAPVPLSQNGVSAQIGVAFSPPGTPAGATPTLPLNQLGKISTSDFIVALPGAIAQALLNDARTHILQNPEIRVTDGQEAKLKIGSRIPYATGTFLPSLGSTVTGTTGGTTSLGLLASTQFQYQDTGVNLDITPHLSATGEVTLKAKVEILSLGANLNVGGIQEPTFGQRAVEHTIRLKEGEVSLLGGLIQKQESRTVSGLPFLGDVPLLHYFFSTESKEVQDTEVLIMLTPHVVRLPESLQSKAIAAGRSSAGSGGPAEPMLPRAMPPAEPQE